MKVKNQTVLKDALHNFATNSGASDEYCTGIAIGVVSGLMAMGFTYNEAIAEFAINFPQSKYIPRYSAIPDAWKDDIFAALFRISDAQGAIND